MPHREAKSWFRLLTDCGQSYYREQWDHPYKEGSSLFRFHFSVANILQSPVPAKHNIAMSRLVVRPYCVVGVTHKDPDS